MLTIFVKVSSNLWTCSFLLVNRNLARHLTRIAVCFDEHNLLRVSIFHMGHPSYFLFLKYVCFTLKWPKSNNIISCWFEMFTFTNKKWLLSSRTKKIYLNSNDILINIEEDFLKINRVCAFTMLLKCTKFDKHTYGDFL